MCVLTLNTMLVIVDNVLDSQLTNYLLCLMFLGYITPNTTFFCDRFSFEKLYAAAAGEFA